MTPKLLKKTLRFFEDLIFVKVHEPCQIAKVRSCEDLTLDQDQPELLSVRNYRSLTRPSKKKVPKDPDLEAGYSVPIPPPLRDLPTLKNINELEDMVAQKEPEPVIRPSNDLEHLKDLINRMERNSSEIDELEKGTNPEFFYLESLV